MKKEKRNVTVSISRKYSNVVKGQCSCPAGKSGYCNHVMALLLELADYSLNQLTTILEEISCTSRLRQWGVPGQASYKSPVMETTVQKETTSKGISSTLYDPRVVSEFSINEERLLDFQETLIAKSKNIGFACCIPPIGEDNKLIIIIIIHIYSG